MEQDHDNDNELKHDNDNESPLPPFDPIQNTDEDLCRTMWIAVVVQAVIDAGGKNCNHLIKAKAREWLEGRGGILSDFAAVCDMAGLNFEKTRARCAELVRGDGEALDFRCMKKPQMHNRMKEDRKRYFRRVERNTRLRNERRDRIRVSNPPGRSFNSNDNCPCGSNDNFNNQPMERRHEQ